MATFTNASCRLERGSALSLFPALHVNRESDFKHKQTQNRTSVSLFSEVKKYEILLQKLELEIRKYKSLPRDVDLLDIHCGYCSVHVHPETY